MMKYQIYKLDFKTAVHFGDGGLIKGRQTLPADTVFSALCCEAAQGSGDDLDRLVDAVSRGRLCISDALPFIGDRYYVPKPMVKTEVPDGKEGDSKVKKLLKKLDYIAVDSIDDFIKGKMDLKKESELFHRNFGRSALVEKVSIRTHRDDGKTDPDPYAVSTFRFNDGSGLYICAGYEDEDDKYLLEDLLMSLSYSGIGGKRSTGYGKFNLLMGRGSEALEKRLGSDGWSRYISLSACLPEADEMEEAIDGASYKLIKRSGFVASAAYSDSFRKKRDVYMLVSGSSFEHRFHGGILDVSMGGSHPVYRYAVPMFMGVL